ncbi:hypothetical protein [Qipengyuania flava]|uniref:hypothetical protein n=1 Tax=Qipengyuania flava TaxID=192812 RepID=UPI001C627855|nr:hypothetical protein [Qipengyuania flava]QYJ06038.1 hypothetical protein KUV82_07985 [Qipengyuania flava]
MTRITRTLGLSLACALAAAAVPQSASAQVPDMDFPADQDFVHEWTGITLPASIGALKRGPIKAFQERQSNIGSQYSDEGNTFLSVYLYRHGAGDASVWHDRARHAIVSRDAYADFDPDAWRTTYFAPGGSGPKSGIMTVGQSDGGTYRSTGVAIFTRGEWMMKIRMSSRRLDATALQGAMTTALNQLGMTAAGSGENAAYPIEQCADDITFSNAERITDPNRISELSAVGGINAATRDDLAAMMQGGSQARYCRQGDNREAYSLYRDRGTKDAYLVAWRDAGVAIVVSRVGDIVGLSSGNDGQHPEYAAILSSALEHKLGGPFDGLPSPQQAYEAAFGDSYFATATRPLGDEGSEVTVTTGSGGEDN